MTAYTSAKFSALDCLPEVTSRIVRQFQPLRIILFGSHARDIARPDSDLDLLVVMPHFVDKRHVAVAIRRVLNGVPMSKDIVVTTPDEIAKRGAVLGGVLRPALREGKVIYECDS